MNPQVLSVTRAQFADQAGVSRSAVSKACRGGELTAASVGKRIDANHRAAKAYLASRKREHAEPVETEAPQGAEQSFPPASSQEPGQASGASDVKAKAAAKAPGATNPKVEGLLSLTLRELYQRYGTETQFKDWLDAVKKIEDIREKRLKNEEFEGLWVSRDMVQTHVMGLLDGFTRRLLSDAAKTIVQRLYAAARDGKTTIEESEQTVRDIIGTQLTGTKTRVERAIRRQ